MGIWQNAVAERNVSQRKEDAMHLAGKFAQPYFGAKVKGRTQPAAEEIHRKLIGIAHSMTSGGCPILDVAMAWLECKAEQFVAAGDHTLVARVLDGRLRRDAQPLTSSCTGWNYSG